MTLTRDELAQQFCRGRGVEIGPGQRPTDVGEAASLAFVDKRSAEELKAYFGSEAVTVGSSLASFEKGDFDFLIAHHVLEHCSNVIQQLIDWMTYLKDDAHLFISVPSRPHCADRTRLITTPTHFMWDYIMGVDDSSFESREHIYSFLWGWSEEGGLFGKSKEEAAALVANAVHAPDNDLHWHVFSEGTLRFVVQTAARLSGRICEICCADNGHPYPEHRLVVSLRSAEGADERANSILELRKASDAVTEFCLEALDGLPLYALAAEERDKIFVAQAGRAHWVRDPGTLVERGISNIDPIYFEFGRERAAYMGKDIITPTAALALDRKQAVRDRISRLDGRGLEISPGAAPLIDKSLGAVLYCDKVGGEAWRDVYHAQNAVVIDVVLGDRSLDEVFTPDSLDYVVSSHVLEHIPDFVAFFISAQCILKPGGDLVMLVPDKRFTFDVLRQPSTIDQIERAHRDRATHPSMDMVCDFYSNIDQAASAEALWTRAHEPRPTFAAAQVEEILRTIKCEDVDLHCWVFTPPSLEILLSHVCEVHAPELRVVAMSDTPTGGNEFLVHLRKRVSAH